MDPAHAAVPTDWITAHGSVDRFQVQGALRKEEDGSINKHEETKS
jgi:hypothetical protein